MRRLFIVLAKIIGLLQVYWGLTYFFSIVIFIRGMGRMTSNGAGNYSSQIIGIILYAVLSFGMAWLLLFKAEWLADKLKIKSDDELPAVSHDVLLNAGVKLIGLYILAGAIPSLSRAIFEADTCGLWGGSSTVLLIQVIPAIIKVLLGFLFAIRTEFVLNLVSKGERAKTKRIVVGGVALLIVAFLFAHILSEYQQSRQIDGYGPWSGADSVVSKYETVIPVRAKNVSTGGWYAVSGVSDADSRLPDFTNSTTGELIKFLADESKVEDSETVTIQVDL